MESLEIKKVRLNDVAALQRIGIQTFRETFLASNSEENMTKYLEEGFGIDHLTKQVSDTASQFYFALLDGEVIGYLKLNRGQSQTDLKNEKSLEIERIYVLGAYHGKKIGQLLYDKAVEIAKELQVDYVWLGVWEHNPRAIRFYQKNGFVEFARHMFKLGEEEQTDIMMKRILEC